MVPTTSEGARLIIDWRAQGVSPIVVFSSRKGARRVVTRLCRVTTFGGMAQLARASGSYPGG